LEPRFEDVYAFGSLLAAFRKARRAKRGQPQEAAFYWDLEERLLELSRQLQSKLWRPDPYRYFVVRHTKERWVAEATFRDRVVHHALVSVLEPLGEDHFIPDTYACRKGKGTHLALRRVKTWTRQHKYFLRLDIRKYFDAILHDPLLQMLAGWGCDEGMLWLCDRILAGAQVPAVPEGQRRGVPIGNLTSQFWANVYLSGFDHWMLTQAPAYARYMDDMVVFADDKATLWRVAAESEARLGSLGLPLKPSATVVAPVTEGVPWLGFRLYPGTTRLQHEGKTRVGRKLSARFRALARGEGSPAHTLDAVRSLLAHLQHADTWALRQALLARLDAEAVAVT
jgi:hypothetical protein